MTLLEKIQDLLHDYPEQRVGQLIVNLSGRSGRVFNITDQELEQRIDNFKKTGNWPL